MRSWANKRDAVEPEVVGVFQQAGWSVVPLNGKGLPDLLVGPPGGVELVEVKTGTNGLTDDQRRWHAAWRGKPVHVIRNAAQARKLVRMLTDAREREVAAAVEARGGGPDAAVEDGERLEVERVRRVKGEEPA